MNENLTSINIVNNDYKVPTGQICNYLKLIEQRFQVGKTFHELQ